MAAQTAPPPAATPFLLELGGGLVKVQYTPGSLYRAARLQERLEPLVRGLASWGAAAPPPVVYLLSREEWASMAAAPYGLPAVVARGGLALCAWGDAGTVELWRGLVGGRLPAPAELPPRGSPEEAASVMLADLLAEVETARLMLRGAGLRGEEEWIDGLLAHVAARSVRLRQSPALDGELAGLYRALAAAAAVRAAPDSGAAGSPARWLVDEARFDHAAGLVLAVEGGGGAKALLKAARRDGGTLGAARLFKRYPELESWVAASGLARAATPASAAD